MELMILATNSTDEEDENDYYIKMSSEDKYIHLLEICVSNIQTKKNFIFQYNSQQDKDCSISSTEVLFYQGYNKPELAFHREMAIINNFACQHNEPIYKFCSWHSMSIESAINSGRGNDIICLSEYNYILNNELIKNYSTSSPSTPKIITKDPPRTIDNNIMCSTKSTKNKINDDDECNDVYLLQLGFSHSSLEYNSFSNTRTWLKKVFQYSSMEDMQLSIESQNSENPFPREVKMYLGNNLNNFHYVWWKPYSLTLADRECYTQGEFLQIQPLKIT
jgi:hypothetical protein